MGSAVKRRGGCSQALKRGTQGYANPKGAKRMGVTRRTFGLLLGAMVLVGAIIVPGTVAQSETVRTEIGVLRLHLDSGVNQRYFRFDTPTEGGYTAGTQQTINGLCPVTSLTGPAWADLTGGSTSFSLNQVGISNNGLGIRFLNCGRVDAPNWALRVKLGAAIDGPGVGVDRAELDLQGWGNVTAVADLFLDGTMVDSVTQFISGNGSRALMVIDRTGETLFDEIRLHPRNLFDAVALRGGGAGSPSAAAGTLRANLGTSDTVFRVVSETTAPSLSVTKSAVVITDGGETWDEASSASAGDSIGFDIEVSNAADAGTASGVVVTDALPTDAGLSWEIDGSSDSWLFDRRRASPHAHVRFRRHRRR